MNKIMLASAAAALTVVASSAASAQGAADSTGAYVSLDAGVSKPSDVRIEYYDEGGVLGGTGAQDTARFRADLGSAVTFGGALGYDFGIIRADVELNYSRNKVKTLGIESLNGTAVTLTAADRAEVCDYLEVDSCGGSGNAFQVDGYKLRQLSALANAWFDVPTGSPVTPYVGGGLGIAGYEVDGEGKARFAWQLGAGVGFDISPSVTLSADYRHRQIKGATIEDEDFPDAGVRISKVKSNLFTASVRFKF